MRFVVYNIRYGTGSGWQFHFPFPFSGYLRRTQYNMPGLTAFLRSLNADVIGLVEVDSGSYRSERLNQAEVMARELDFAHVYQSKYGTASAARKVPVLCDQGNAFITNLPIHDQGFHYFEKGIKRLVIELEFEDFVIFLVHLSLRFRHRQDQLSDLHALFSEVKKPKIVAGDFNAFWGEKELSLFRAAAGLENANVKGIPTFPSKSPRRQLDFILHSPEIVVKRFAVPAVTFSDHRPLVCDFEVES